MKKLAFLIILVYFCLFETAQAAMNDYCVIPTPSASVAKPNILIVMDFSGSMQFPAYVSCGSYYYSGTVINCGTGTSTSSDAYSATTNYYGLFDKDKYYKHNGTQFLVNTSCTNTDRIGAIGGSATTACISGNLLNWVSGTRVDVSRQVLTGRGKTTATTDIYQSEGASMVFTDTNLRCKFTTAQSSGVRTIAVANQTGYTCALGTMSAQYMYMPSTDTGIIQDFYDKATFEFMIFNTDLKGKLLAAKDSTQSTLLAAVSSEQPYNGTPTGEALYEAEDFFKQSNDHWYQSNSTGISLGNGTKDPWYDVVGSVSKGIRCRKTFVLLISDGNWNSSIDPVGPAKEMHVTDLRSDLSDTQTVTTYVIYAFGDKDADTKLQGQRAMITTAIYGGFDDLDKNGRPYPWTGDPGDSRYITYPRPGCDPSGTWDAQCREWDRSRTGLPYNYFEADDGEVLKTSIMNALNDMLRRTSSGTAASVLASSEGSGANILQSVFFPKRMFADAEVSWTGEMQNLWYFVDPYLQYSSIREDTDTNRILNLGNDYAIEYFFDTTDYKTKVNRYTTSVDGSGKTYYNTVPIEDIKNLWEAGSMLFQRNLTSSPRTLYTTTNGSSLSAFSAANSSALYQYLQAADATEATKIINYVHGTDQTGCRSRTVTISGTTGVWKLGDVVSSTPKIQSSIPTNSYHLAAPSGYSDSTYLEYIRTSGYQSRGMSYVGGNDGMLHAFKFGNLLQSWTGKGTTDKAMLDNPDASTALGSEAWAFIPKHALPYLKYTMQTDYCHLNFVDLPPVLVDASVNGAATDARTVSSWRSILIGGMGMGGASRITSDSCTAGASGTCVKTPRLDPSDSTKGLGHSSYFAIDVTNPASPQLLWELADPALGFSTSGPAIVRIGAADKNGKWFAVFASGPTGPIDTTNRQFLGASDQNLKFFVVDLYAGTVTTIDTGLSNAFGGSLYNGAADLGRLRDVAPGRYNDDVVYLGYTQKDTTAGTWTKGGVLRLVTQENPDPTQWAVSTVIDNIGPVTSSIAKVQDFYTVPHTLWLYFGSGRFFYRYDTTLDDPLGRRAIYGVKDKCFNGDTQMSGTCSTTPVIDPSSNLVDQTSTIAAVPLDKLGWRITLDPALQSGGSEATTLDVMALGAERDITDPLAVSGAVFFTTYAPSSDICSQGGYTYIWAVRWNTGGAVNLAGNAVTQVSTGVIRQVSLGSGSGSGSGSDLTQSLNRKTGGIMGMPPKTQGLSIQVPPRPLQRFMHIREK
jgi:type IV pilus assembly protein PilY1